ncbi:tetratricopeptide repeat protein [Lyngbya sp. CCY1209]|uniref:tetratricopeptide repeat protein n=1 Tax=Lyngbya sp. CCY1209 TaxID=2886103 RepID=UPI002D20571C|nr:tetratricopeptide repeat protein [Lyngbya sp. CCY1209]MEB3884176.1 tetratricopeptide repeat protein [Lyngbya sp. CCY1209]
MSVSDQSQTMQAKEILQKSVQFLQQQAEVYLRQGQIDDARKACEQLLKIQPNAAAGFKILGDVSLRQGDLEGAKQRYAKALELQPNWAEAYANLGSLYARSQQWEQAIAAFQKAIAIKPEFAGAYRNLAKVWTQLNRTAEALRAQYKAYTLEPQAVTAQDHLNLGNTFLQQDQTAEAAICYQNAIRLDATLAAAYHNLGEALKRQGKMPEAAPYFRKAIELKAWGGTAQTPADTLAAATATSGNVAPSQDTLAAATAGPQATPPQNATNGIPVKRPANPETLLQEAKAYCAIKQWEPAVSACQKALRLNPQLAEAYKIQGNALQVLGEMEAAVRSYNKALEIQPQFPEVYANLGSLYAQEERLEKALGCYQQAIAQNQNVAGFYRNLAKVLERMGRNPEASRCLERAWALEPDKASPEDHVRLGNTRLGEGKPEEALASYQRALEGDPRLAAAYFGIGKAKASQGAWNEAEGAYRQAIALDPKPGVFYQSLAEAFVGQENMDGAVAIYRQLLQANPNWAWAHHQIGEIRNRQWKLKEAETAYRQAVGLDPNLAPAHYGLGTVLARQKRWADLVPVLSRALELDANAADGAAYKSLADGFSNTDRKDEAIAHYEKASELDGENAEIWQKLGDLRRDKGAWEDAIAAYEKANQLDPDLFWSHNGLADVLLKLERWEEAVEAYQKAIGLKSDYSWSYNSLGDALAQLERWKEAAEAYRQAARLNPEFPWSHYNLGEVAAKLGNWEAAVDGYRGAIAAQSDLPAIQEKLADALRERAKQDLEEALGYYRQVMEQEPDNVATYHKAIEIRPDDAGLYVKLADTLARHTEMDGAIVFYQMAQQLEPDDGEIAARLEQVIQKKNEGLERPIVEKPSEEIVPLPLPTQKKSRPSEQKFPIDQESYEQWLRENLPRPADLRQMSQAVNYLGYKPIISVIMPVYNTPERFLRQAIESVTNQVYPNWELCIADDNSTEPWVQPILEEYARKDNRIKVAFRTENGHICAASNSALELATGEYIALLDHDDVITPEALYEVALVLNQHPDADMIYSDEDKLDQYGQRVFPYFKPDWCPDSFLARMYTCHLGVYRRELVNAVGNFRVGYEGSQDYDLVLRVTEKTDKIFHIPKVLYSWRQHGGSTAYDPNSKLYAYIAAEKALNESFIRRGEKARIVSDHQNLPGQYTIRYHIQEYKRVSIIIPTRNLGTTLNHCLRSIFEKSTYPNYEVVVIDNGSDEPETLDILKAWKQKEPERFSCYEFDVPFNYPQINNYGVSKARGDYLLFLNNDTEVLTPDWIEAMLEQAQRASIGAVGPLLLYPDDTVQHAGVVLGIGGVAGHSHKGYQAHHLGYYNHLITVNNYSAVTGACLMCRREVFEEVGGLDEEFAVAFNDVDFCLKLVRQGYRNIYLPHVVLYHYESKSRGYEDTPEKEERFKRESKLMKQRWGDLLKNDPYYNPNLSRIRQDYSIRLNNDENQVMAIFLSEDQEAFLGCAIDSPKLHQPFDEENMLVQGWALGKYSPAVGIQVMCGDRIIGESKMNQERGDVAKVFPDVPHALDSGFVKTIDVSETPSEVEILILALMQDGNQVPLATLCLRHGNSDD